MVRLIDCHEVDFDVGGTRPFDGARHIAWACRRVEEPAREQGAEEQMQAAIERFHGTGRLDYEER